MKSKLITLTIILIALSAFSVMAQDGIGIGTIDPNEKAILHIQSTGTPKGMLIPRYNSAGRDLINPSASPDDETGLIIYNTDINAFEYYDGTSWIRLIPTPAKFGINMNSQKLTNLDDGTNPGDAVNKSQLDGVDSNNLDRDGTDAMTGDLNMGGERIRNLANGSQTSDAATISQLNNVETDLEALIANLESRVVETHTVAGGGTSVPGSLENSLFFSSGGSPRSIFTQRQFVTNTSPVTKSYFCMGFVNLGGPGGPRDVTLQLKKEGNIFARWRKLIRAADPRAEDLYMISGRFTLNPGESAEIRNEIRIEANSNLYYDNRGLLILSEF